MTVCSVFQESFVVDYLKGASLKDEPNNHNVTTTNTYGQEILVH